MDTSTVRTLRLNYGVSIPIELDEAARIDGASPVQVYLRIYLPLMAPALVAVGTYALLLAWNEYLYRRRDVVLLIAQDRRRPGARHDNPIGTHARGPLLCTIGQC